MPDEIDKFVQVPEDQYDSLAVDAKRKIAQETYRNLKKNIKLQAAQAAQQRAVNLIDKLKREIEDTDAFVPEVKSRTVKQMHDFGYGIINRELTRLDQLSIACGLNDDQIQSLTRLMSTLNVTEKTKKSINEEVDETKQREGESDEDYRTRLESAIKR